MPENLAESWSVIPALAAGAVGEGPGSDAFLSDGGGSVLQASHGDVKGRRRTCQDLCSAL